VSHLAPIARQASSAHPNPFSLFAVDLNLAPAIPVVRSNYRRVIRPGLFEIIESTPFSRCGRGRIPGLVEGFPVLYVLGVTRAAA
jgi:hypothetical protein